MADTPRYYLIDTNKLGRSVLLIGTYGTRIGFDTMSALQGSHKVDWKQFCQNISEKDHSREIGR